ncbi:MAG TPA: dihydrodipicolinate reductase [Anaerolineae bacterium]|nr:dihydrodipicolinate reductase [Anaerolineae bacterium]
MNPIPVIHFGLGPIGQQIGRTAASEPRLVSVGAVDINPELQEFTLNQVCDADLPDLPIVSSLAQVQAPPGAVVLQATFSKLTQARDQLMEAIARGYNVVSTCEELVWPWEDHPDLARELDEAAKKAGVTLLGVGVNPGMIMDALPALLSRLTSDIESIHVARFVDVLERRIPLQEKNGLGKDPAWVQEQLDRGAIGHVGLKDSLYMLAAGLGWDLDVVAVESKPIVAKEAIESGLGWIEPGQCKGVRQEAQGLIAGEPRITMELVMEAGVAGGSRDETFITGDQTLHMKITGVHGDKATAAIIVNQAIRVPAMPAGLQTMLSAPLVPRPTRET